MYVCLRYEMSILLGFYVFIYKFAQLLHPYTFNSLIYIYFQYIFSVICACRYMCIHIWEISFSSITLIDFDIRYHNNTNDVN